MDLLHDAFAAEAFRSRGHRLIDELADYLDRATRGERMAILPWVEPEASLDAWPAHFPLDPPADAGDLLARVVAGSNHLHHPRYVGHQVTAPLPLAALCEMVGTLLNNGTAVYEMGPVSVPMERALIRWMAGLVGFGPAADGIFTSGGSIGNLTALLAARQAKAGFDVWGQGNAGGPPLAVLVSSQAHYSVRRAVQIMGWGEGGVIPVPVDGHFRLRVDALDDAMEAARAAGRRVIAVVASAGSTATGAFDPIGEIADFCTRQGLWLHVDGAHGASAALSDRHRHLVAGIERADSVVWDAHKMMLMPALITTVLFRDGRRSYESFAQEASYLFAEGQPPEQQWFNSGQRTLECTKRMMAVTLYVSLATHGTRVFSDYISATFDLAPRFAESLRAAPDFELAVEPQGNIVCFRHTPADVADLDRLQEDIRRRILADGSFYLVQTRLPAGIFLRTTLINPLTRDDDLAALLEAVRAAARHGNG